MKFKIDTLMFEDMTLTREENSNLGYFSVRKYWDWKFVVECFDKMNFYLFYHGPF
jgi:hypothetical protein